MFRLSLAVVALLIGLPGVAAAQPLPYGPPSTTVTSQIGLMNELQKRGPYAYSYGPDAGGRYVVVGPNAFPVPYRLEHARRRHHHHYR